MPLSDKAKRMKRELEKEYGKDKGERVFYAMENQGKVPGKRKKGK